MLTTPSMKLRNSERNIQITFEQVVCPLFIHLFTIYNILMTRIKKSIILTIFLKDKLLWQ